jgi:hypothetical protein
MKKQIEIHGQHVELYSSDEGHTWSSNPQSIVAYGQRQKILRLELKQRFARIDEMQDPNLMVMLDSRCQGDFLDGEKRT